MKITHLKVRNIGIIGDADIEINRPLLIFYGECRAGKSTILQSVKWCLGGAFPSDIIRHSEKEASIELGFDGGCVTRSWYRSKEGEVKARAVQFVRNGRPVANPVAELKRLCNPFLLDQDFLRNKSELERKQFFAETFAVDTSALDTELFTVQRKAQELRAKLTGYGEMDLTPVESVNTADLRSQLAEARQAHQQRVQAAQKQKSAKLAEWNQAVSDSMELNERARRANGQRKYYRDLIERRTDEIQKLEEEIEKLKSEIRTHEKWLDSNPVAPEVQPPPQPETAELDAVIASAADTADLEAKLQNAAAQNVRAEQYRKDLERANQRKTDESLLKAAEDRARAIKKDKIAALAKVSETCGVPELSFDEDGTFSFEGTTAGMLSTSQIMRLSSLLSALYPPELSLGIELLDRGESLGRSIFDYVKHAEARKISVLATVVGQKPADVPAKVGVWVVRDGVVLPDSATKET